MIDHKGYLPVFEVDPDSGLIHGRVAGIRDVVTFQGPTVAEAVEEFRTSVDVYLELCERRGEAPDRPYSGKFLVRVAPELHRALSREAEAQGRSLNDLVAAALAEAMLPHPARPPAAALTSETSAEEIKPGLGPGRPLTSYAARRDEDRQTGPARTKHAMKKLERRRPGQTRKRTKPGSGPNG